MKPVLFIVCVVSAIFCATVIATPLLGAKECTWGPSYWCKNITAATHCKAVKHCIQTIWEKQTVAPDNDSICQICTNMVKQARDQLESNETQEELKEVFEGSCKLIPLKIISQECCKLADDFIPQLVETLASQMNPQVVCSVAGLCNNARIDKLLAEQEAQRTIVVPPKNTPSQPDECKGCYSVVGQMQSNFQQLTSDQVLEGMLTLCGRMGSFSDGCASVVITYFTEIYDHFKNHLEPEEVCHITGVCSGKFHQHPEIPTTSIEIMPHGVIGVQSVSDDDLPCKLCAQLVSHLRDLLIANTTEGEFQRVLEGICKQTKTFKPECLSIVDEYYTLIYEFLVSKLNSKEVCVLAGICPGPGLLSSGVPIWPVVPVHLAQKAEKLMSKQEIIETDEVSSFSPEEPLLSNLEIQNAQLPIDRILPGSLLGLHNSQACSLCEYLLHYIQVEISDSKNEQIIKKSVENICDKLPGSIKGECSGFIETYGDALIALLAQEIDPSTMCPMLSLCPKENVKDVEVLIHESHKDKPNCPLCLFAVKQLEDMVKNKKTVANIKQALDSLCSHLPKDLEGQCDDFVDSYSTELIDMLIADLDPQEVCVYLKLCAPKESKLPKDRVSVLIDELSHHNGNGEILTNEIPDDTIGGQPLISAHLNLPRKDGPQCVLCEFIMTQVENVLKNRRNEEEIKQAVLNVCHAMPKSVRQQCDQFVEEYADMIIQLLVQLVEPKDICGMMHFCNKDPPHLTSAIKHEKQVGGPLCPICKYILTAIETQLNGSINIDDIKRTVHGICNVFNGETRDDCNSFLKQYADLVIDFLANNTSPDNICSLMFLCAEDVHRIQSNIMECAICEETVGALHMLLQNPNVDHDIDHILKKACSALPGREVTKCKEIITIYGRSMVNLLIRMTDTKTVCKKVGLCGSGLVSVGEKKRALGSNKCTYGPSYWCSTVDAAHECKALDHCQKNIWKQPVPPK